MPRHHTRPEPAQGAGGEGRTYSSGRTGSAACCGRPSNTGLCYGWQRQSRQDSGPSGEGDRPIHPPERITGQSWDLPAPSRAECQQGQCDSNDELNRSSQSAGTFACCQTVCLCIGLALAQSLPSTAKHLAASLPSSIVALLGAGRRGGDGWRNSRLQRWSRHDNGVLASKTPYFGANFCQP